MRITWSQHIGKQILIRFVDWLIPEEITHSWLEVAIDGHWHPVDTSINDLTLHKAAVHKLKDLGWETGYSISRVAGEPSAELDLYNVKYSQMGVVVGEHPNWAGVRARATLFP